ncbi:MAG TPA: ABC transporter permease [Gammaproteobacteria bacterium]
MQGLLRTLAIMFKEVRQLSRDRLTFSMILGIPMMQILLFGYAINTDVRNLDAAVVDLADTELSRKLTASLEASQVLDFNTRSHDVNEVIGMMRSGDISVGLYIPSDFERRIRQRARSRSGAQLLVDGSDPTIVGVVQRLNNTRLDLRNGIVAVDVPGVEIRNYYNPERRSAVQIVPALIGVILTLTMVLFTAVAIVRERERGNFELLITTPVRNVELMVGKILPYILIGLVQVSIVLAVGSLLFSVPITGSIFDLYLASLLFIAATLGLGLVIATVAKSQFQAMQMTMLVFLPSILLSGFMFPFDGMPRVAQWIGLALPLTHFVEMIRGIMLRGAGLAELMPRVYSLVAFFFLAMGLAVLKFRKRLD